MGQPSVPISGGERTLSTPELISLLVIISTLGRSYCDVLEYFGIKGGEPVISTITSGDEPTICTTSAGGRTLFTPELTYLPVIILTLGRSYCEVLGYLGNKGGEPVISTIISDRQANSPYQNIGRRANTLYPRVNLFTCNYFNSGEELLRSTGLLR